MKIDFRKFRLFTDITQEKTKETDVSFKFADMLYKKCDGIMAHDLALRIYKSKDPVEFTQEELDALMPFVNTYFTPLFIDSFTANIR